MEARSEQSQSFEARSETIPAKQSRQQCEQDRRSPIITRPTSFFSRGVPGIGTRALTGNDSGCSGRLKGVTLHQSFLNPGRKRAVLGQLPDQPNSISVRLTKTQNSARAYANARLADCGDGAQSFVVRTGGNHLDSLDRGCLFNLSLICSYFGIILPRSIEVMVVRGQTTANR